MTLRIAAVALLLLTAQAAHADLAFTNGAFDGWTVEGANTWSIGINPPLYTDPGDAPRYVVNSYEKGEQNTGTLRSEPFTISKPVQSFRIAGWDGTADTNNGGDHNWVLLRSHPDGEILRRAHTPGGNKLTLMNWFVAELTGRKAYVEVVDNNPGIRKGGFAWIAFADYQQGSQKLSRPVTRDLYALQIDDGAEILLCRSVPFLAQNPNAKVKTARKVEGSQVTIPVGAQADTIYLLGMLNWGWDYGVAHWCEHPELKSKRDDQVHIGSRIGEIEIRYADGAKDVVPIEMGATAWWVAQWGYGPTHGVAKPVQEPFISKPDCRAALERSLRLRISDGASSANTEWRRQFLAITPRAKRIESIVVRDNPALRGRPLVSAVTLASPMFRDSQSRNKNKAGEAFRDQGSRNIKMTHLGKVQLEAADANSRVRSDRPANWSSDVAALKKALYTSTADLPKVVKLIAFPEGLDAARVRFIGGAMGDMLSNVWVANLAQMNGKFERDTGVFHETERTSPWYGGYSGIGTWAPVGVYYTGAFARCSDHYATVALRCINDPVRTTSYVDFCDNWLYFYRADHDPANGPANDGLDIARYPKGAPGHWSFFLNSPLEASPAINEIPGNEEMDGHGATAVARWLSWRLMGAPKGEWLMAPRAKVFGKSRWDSTRDAAEFICWFMDYTGRDVIFNEGETTCWGANGVPAGMLTETDPVKIRENYANANMYEPYPTYTCLVALRCSAQMAEATGNADLAKRWRAYADRLQAGMVRLLRVGDSSNRVWRVSPHSVYPSLQDSLVQAWFSIYYDGLDPVRLDPTMTSTSRNTLDRQLNQRCGLAAVLAMGYGQGWLTKSALILDDLDSAGPLLTNIAKYSYDKNMDYSDPSRGIDWRKWLWLIPEGTNIMPDGSWHRIGDLTNGANQGPAMHALELCAGIDDTHPAALKIIPRVPKPLSGIEVENFVTLVPDGDGLATARVKYQFKRPGYFALKSDRRLPTLAVRLGPFDEAGAKRVAEAACPLGTKRAEKSGTWNGKDAWWVWVEGLKDVTTMEISLPK